MSTFFHFWDRFFWNPIAFFQGVLPRSYYNYHIHKAMKHALKV